MSETSLSIGRIGLIFLIISQIATTTYGFLLGEDLLYYALLIVFGFSILLANFIFMYFDQAYDSTLAKVTFIFTMIAILGLLIAAAMMLVAIITLNLGIMLITLLLLLFILPAELVFNILWGATFIMVREQTNNPPLMLAGGILFLLGILSGMFFWGLLTFLAVIGLILVTIVMFSEGKA